MITFLAKHFIRNYQDTGNPKVREQYGQLSGIVGIVLNLCLFAGKLTAGLLSGAISILADASACPARSRTRSTRSATAASNTSQASSCLC